MPVDRSLNEPQRRAVDHSKGPLLVLAGPGSGKTRVVTHRIARLIEKGIAARSILAVTFTNKAAREMRERVRALVGRQGKDLTVATFHSACVRILREEIGALGYGKNFTIYDESSQESLVRTILRDLKGVGSTGSSGALLQAIGMSKQPPRTLGPPSVPEGGGEDGDGGGDPGGAASAGASAADAGAVGAAADPEAAAREVFFSAARDRYEAELKARNAIDFDDIILLTGKLFREKKDALARWRERFSHLLVDEYQDTNASQDEILNLLAGEHRNLCVVGDDDQSIYGWRGAEVEHILHFKRRYPEATVVKLEQNYRSTREIVAVASAVIGKNPKRHKKDLFTRRTGGSKIRVLHLRDDEEEAEHLAKEIAGGVLVPEGTEGNPWELGKGYAVLFRTNEAMRPIEQALRALKVPYRLIGGRSFFDRKEVIDVLAYLRVAANPDDEEALFRIANVPARGLGARALQSLRDAARDAKAPNTWSALASIAGRTFGAAPPDGITLPGIAGIGRLVEVVGKTAREAEARSRTLIADLVAAIDYRSEIDRTYKDPQVQEARAMLLADVQKTWEHYLEDAAGGPVAPPASAVAAAAAAGRGASASPLAEPPPPAPASDERAAEIAERVRSRAAAVASSALFAVGGSATPEPGAQGDGPGGAPGDESAAGKRGAAREGRARTVRKPSARSRKAAISSGPAPFLAGFLDSLSLGDRDEDERDPGGVTLATVHASKGLEFANVYVAGLEEGAFPHGRSVDDHSLEEERRLFYVAITRAKDNLTLTRSVVRTVRGKEIRTVPSRYLAEFPPELVDERDFTKPASEGTVVDMLARMRAKLGR